MVDSHRKPSRAQVGRADLLRALALAERDRLPLEDHGETWLGYVRQAKLVEHRGTVSDQWSVNTLTDPPPSPPTPARRLPLKMPSVVALASREARPAPESTAPDPRPPAEPLDSAGPPAVFRKSAVGYEDLVPEARLLPALRRWLGAVRSGPLDLDRLARDLAGRTLPQRLPRRRFQRWHPDLVVVLDFCPRLWPYREDQHRLAERLLRHCGRSGVSLRIFNHGPSGRWTDWVAEQSTAERPASQVWTLPPAGTPVLIAGDLGLLLGADSGEARAWAGFAERLTQAGLRPLALAPLGTEQLDGEMAKILPIVRWSPDGRMHPERVHGPAQPAPDGLADLLALAAVPRRVDPPLLRALRRLVPGAGLHAGLEGAFWCHGDVEAGSAAQVRTDCRDAHLDRFRRLSPHLHSALENLRIRHHGHLPDALQHEEALAFGAHADPAEAAAPEIAARIVEAEEFLRRLAATFKAPDRGSSGGWRAVARAIEARADAGMVQRYGELLVPLVAERVRDEKARGLRPRLPDWVDPRHIDPWLPPGPDERCNVWLVRDAASASVVLQARPAGPRQSPIDDKRLHLDGAGVRITVARMPDADPEIAGNGRETAVFSPFAQPRAGRTQWFWPQDLPIPIVPLNWTGSVRLETALEVLTLEASQRPKGLESWRCDRQGLRAESTELAGRKAVWNDADLIVGRTLQAEEWPFAADPLSEPIAVKFDIDEEYGLSAVLRVSTPRGEAFQRFRYIEPGTFSMGSPVAETEGQAENDNEKTWFDREHPQHPVTLTRGYWLADTPCTQAFWQAVMGTNPSRFQSRGRPVEQVSWNGAQSFLRKLESLIPGLRADLPTEAEWEYACRAATETALYNGSIAILGARNAPALDSIAWYGGNSGVGFELKNGYDSSDWPDKQYPDSPSGTHPVGQKRPNAWGLYDMQGNVWEWCSDGLRDYGTEAVADPIGPVETETPRAVRGGSWSGDARFVRSAYRLAFHPGFADFSLGFRVCLRSMGSGPEGMPGGHPEDSAFPRDEGRPSDAKRPRRWFDWLIPGRKDGR